MNKFVQYNTIISQANGRFGASIAIVDLNADGRNDLAVSAPCSGALNLTYQVYIFFLTFCLLQSMETQRLNRGKIRY